MPKMAANAWKLGDSFWAEVNKGHKMTLRAFIKVAILLSAALALAGCEEGANPFGSAGKGVEGSAVEQSSSTKLVVHDVEAPEVFQVAEAGLWDGRPSLGGVWVAHPTAVDPMRVIIRNEVNGKFVIGALFRRERENPGPRLQVSSDAADALGMLAGQPVKINVTALRSEEVQEKPEATAAATLDAPEEIDTPEAIETETLDPIASATAALDAVDAKATPTASAPKASTATASKSSNSSVKKPYLQLGIFSVEANARGTAEQMRKAGIVPTVKEQSSKGKTFWRVIVGPVNSASEKEALLVKVKAQGFSDAYFVTN